MSSKTQRHALIALVIFLLLITIENIIFANIHGILEVVLKISGILGVFALCVYAGLDWNEVGLSSKTILPGLKLGLICIGVVFLGLITVFIVDKSIFQDDRYDQDVSAALYAALLVVPVKTILFEEVSFRGILPGLLHELKVRRLYIYIVSSVLFGLWHLLTVPSTSDYSGVSIPGFIIPFGIFVATSAAGAFFYFLREKSDSLLAPFLLHWFINGFTIILAAYSWR